MLQHTSLGFSVQPPQAVLVQASQLVEAHQSPKTQVARLRTGLWRDTAVAQALVLLVTNVFRSHLRVRNSFSARSYQHSPHAYLQV